MRRTVSFLPSRVYSSSTASLPVSRAVSILELLADEGELGVTELGRRLGVHKATASRLVFADGDRGAVVTGAAGGGAPSAAQGAAQSPAKPARPAKAKTPAAQGDLF